MNQNLVLCVVFLAIAVNTGCNAKKVVCDDKIIRIYNNVYVESVLKIFDNEVPTKVRFNEERDGIMYSLNDMVYQIDDDGDDYEIDATIPTSDVVIKGAGELKVLFEKATKPSSFHYENENTLSYGFHKDLVFAIKLPSETDPFHMYGSLYAVNKSDSNLVGGFIVTERVKEKVYDLDVKSKTGNLLLLVYNDSDDKTELLQLKLLSTDPCKNEKCTETHHMTKEILMALEYIQDDIIDSYEENIDKTIKENCVDKKAFEEIKAGNQRLSKQLEDVLALLETYRKPLIDPLFAEMMVDRMNEDVDYVCTTEEVFNDQKKSIDIALNELNNTKKRIQDIQKRFKKYEKPNKVIPKIDPRYHNNMMDDNHIESQN